MQAPPSILRIERAWRGDGFTLIELSIVLVIIGLIIGGIIVGRDLIAASEIRAQISQIEKYNTAVRTFQLKYGYLPGDIPDPAASGFGFKARGLVQGKGDGNNVIEGFDTRDVAPVAMAQGQGETVAFWVDLSTAGLIDGVFNIAGPNVWVGGYLITPLSTPFKVGNFWPQAKIGGSNYVQAYSGGPTVFNVANSDGNNYFGLVANMIIDTQNNGGKTYQNPNVPAGGIRVQQAFAIDSKTDNGLPQSGKILALLPYYFYTCWTQSNVSSTCASAASTTALSASLATCFDNNNVGGAVRKYSTSQNDGLGVNCGLSFRFQ